MSDKPCLLVAVPLDPSFVAHLTPHFDIVFGFDPTLFEVALAEKGGALRAVLARNQVSIGAAELDHMPRLELVVVLGSGMDSIDKVALDARSIRLATGRGVNADAVADHAFALMLPLLRDIRGLDLHVRKKGWGVTCQPPRSIGGTRLGIIGLGAIGTAVARRAEAFGMVVAYHGPRAKPGVYWNYHSDPARLAAASEVLILCCPGGEETRHLVDARIMAALGREGVIVNVARGSVVDTGALITAMEKGELAGAGLDVLEASENEFSRLTALPNVLLTPHTAGRSPQSLKAADERALATLKTHFGIE